MKHPDHTLIQADVLLPLNQSDEPRVNIGDNTTGDGVQSGGSLWGTDGFISVPDAPDDNGACQVYYFPDGDQKVVIARRDNRLVDKIGNLASTPGTKAIVNSSGGRFVLNKTGAITLETTTDQTDNGPGVYLRVSSTALEFHAPWGAIVFDETGLHVMTQSGACLDMGGFADPSCPNYFTINATSVILDTASAQIGLTVANGGSGVFMAPVVAPIGSGPGPTPTPIGVGVGAVMGVTGGALSVGV